MTKYKVSFQYSENIYCTNIAIAENIQDVENHYSKYAWFNITEATDGDIKEAERKGMPIITIEHQEEEKEEGEKMANFEIKENKQFNSLEVYFTGKPDEATRNNLKALKFRWNGKKLCWYGFAELEEVTKACEGGQIETTRTAPKKDIAPAADKDEQKRLFEIFLEEVKTIWTKPDMVEYKRKTTQHIVELQNGDIIAIEKPRIKTTFCFGYGMYLQSTDEEYKAARDAETNARTNEEYFINQNLQGLEETIKNLRDEDKRIYTYIGYTGQPENGKLKSYTVCRAWETPENAPHYFYNLKAVTELDMNDRERIAKGYEIVKAHFEKRLHTYLKRYGLKKLNTWTYLVD